MTIAPPIRYAETSDGLRIAYWSIGEGEPLLMLTDIGWGHSTLMWEQNPWGLQLELLAEHFQFIYFDSRNHGLSTRGSQRLSLDDLLLDIDAVMRTERIESAALYAIGHRTKVAVEYAVRAPERVSAIVLSHPVVGRVDNLAGYQDMAMIFPLARTNWRQFTNLTATVSVGLDDPVQTKRAAEFIRASIGADDYRHCVAALSTVDVSDELARVSVPTFIITAENDWFSLDEVQRIAASIPGAEVSIIAGENPYRALLPTAETIIDRLAAGHPGSPEPTGFSTILFTDVVSSTPLLSQLKDERMRAVMRDHDAVCEAAITEHGGRVVKTIGDAFMAEFKVPSAAIEAAIAIQRGIRERFANTDVPLQLRIGINAGEPIALDGDLHGASVVIAKRLESAAEAGGILVSDVVRQAVAGKDFTFEDRGEVELKGFDQPVRAWAVRW